MHCSSMFGNRDDVMKIASAIENLDIGNVNIMEVCGTHTMSIASTGIKQILPEGIKLISGPGCPVCVTPSERIDDIYKLSLNNDIIVATYGDMIRVPGMKKDISLERSRIKGADIRIVYSSIDALKIAADNPKKMVVFLGVGFETTAPSTAAAIKLASENRIDNFLVFSLHKKVKPVLSRLLDTKEVKVDGFLLPGHVAVVTGEKEFKFLEEEYKIPGVIGGFEPCDILKAIYMIIEQIKHGSGLIMNEYTRLVSYEGNTMAAKAIDEVFEPCADIWRGLGTIESSGMKIKDIYKKYDAVFRLGITYTHEHLDNECRCGDILKGLIEPSECMYFGTYCTPDSPVGPCMVSSEGTCAAAYKYR